MGQLPHVLSFARVVLVLATHFAAWRLDVPLFATLVLLAALTDILDGPLARAYGTASRFGANVDTAADMMFYLSLPLWVLRFEPAVILDHWGFVSAFVVLYLCANYLSQRTFGALGVHNKLSRASGTAGVLFALGTILWGFDLRAYYALMALLLLDLGQRYAAVARAKALARQTP